MKRPDKFLLSGLKTLGNLTLNLYSETKAEAKGRGEIAFIGEKKIDEVQSQLYTYNTSEFQIDRQIDDFGFLQSLDPSKVYWLNLHGLHEVDVVEKIGISASLDRIIIRQILDTTIRPKFEEYDNYLFFSLKSVVKDKSGSLKLEQLSFVLGSNFIISFQEEPADHFDYIRNKLEEKLGLVRKKKADFLLYQLLDALLDNYFETIDAINSEIKSIEKQLLSQPTQELLVQLENLKRVSEMIKKSLNPFKDSLKTIQNRKTAFIDDNNNKYFTDLTNGCVSATEEIGISLNSLESLTNIYFSALSHKMNETMKILSIVATIFIPLTFIAGIYGMNFENMPELRNPNGYFYTLGAMGLILVGMFIYFKKKKWL